MFAELGTAEKDEARRERLFREKAEELAMESSKPEFDGHYADDVSVDLTVIPEPTALAIWGALSAFGLVAVRRRPCRSKNR